MTQERNLRPFRDIRSLPDGDGSIQFRQICKSPWTNLQDAGVPTQALGGVTDCPREKDMPRHKIGGQTAPLPTYRSRSAFNQIGPDSPLSFVNYPRLLVAA